MAARRGVLVVGGLALIVGLWLGWQVVQRWRDVRGYEDAPTCGTEQTAKGDSKGCKLVTDGQFKAVECQGRNVTSDCSYSFAVRVDGAEQVRSTYLDSDLRDRLHPGDRLRVEMYDGRITKVATGAGKLPDTAAPQRSATILTIATAATLIFGLILVGLALRRPSDAATSSRSR